MCLIEEKIEAPSIIYNVNVDQKVIFIASLLSVSMQNTGKFHQVMNPRQLYVYTHAKSCEQ